MFLGLWLCHSNFCLPLHLAFSSCVSSLGVSSIRTLVIGFRARLTIQDCLISRSLIQLHLQRDFFQIRSYSQDPVWRHISEGHSTQPTAPTKLLLLPHWQELSPAASPVCKGEGEMHVFSWRHFSCEISLDVMQVQLESVEKIKSIYQP